MNQRQYKIEFIPNIETWAQIDGYDNYQVSQFGRIRNSKTGKIRIATPTPKGYPRIKLSEGNGQFYVHRLVANAFLENPLNKQCVDHIDGNKANNHISNLRFATHSENNYNKEKQKGNFTSNYKGVIREGKDKYKAYICHNNKTIHIGYYDNPHEAGMAYDEKAKELFGEYARLNFED